MPQGGKCCTRPDINIPWADGESMLSPSSDGFFFRKYQEEGLSIDSPSATGYCLSTSLQMTYTQPQACSNPLQRRCMMWGRYRAHTLHHCRGRVDALPSFALLLCSVFSHSTSRRTLGVLWCDPPQMPGCKSGSATPSAAANFPQCASSSPCAFVTICRATAALNRMTTN